MQELYIGLMSGTSIDGVDAVLVDFKDQKPQLIASHSEAFSEHLFKGLQRLCLPGSDEINRLGRLDKTVGELFAKAVQGVLNKSGISADDIIAIGSHGQTIRHMPNLDTSFTIQIGDPNTIAVKTGIDVIADFRRKDMALGGQGAPLVPAFHQQVFAKMNTPRIILNIGGIANITYLPANDSQQVVGFDTGPGNTLMDYWCQQRRNQAYDVDGQWARSGHSDPSLLHHMLSHSYFAMPYPKSTGREMFNHMWLEQQLADFNHLKAEDIQSTLLDLTCQSIANDVITLSPSGELYVCGGGAFNSALMSRLVTLLPSYTIASTEKLGVAPQWVEAIAFAWLAMRYQKNLPGNLPAVTGAQRLAILGGKYPAA